MKKLRCLAVLMLLLGILGGCAHGGNKKYTETYLDLFDTVTTVVGYDESEQAFREKAQAVYEELLEYHRLFDIYHTYDGMTNLKTLNDAAGGEALAVDERLFALLKSCMEYYELTGGRTNIALGSVLQLWHEAREAAEADPSNARLPSQAALEDAATHIDPNDVILDEEARTVRIADPALRLDVGAVAKGWALQRVAETAPKGLLISVGGNVCPTGAKDAAGTPWVVGITDPDGGAYLHTVYTTTQSVVTSGDYRRYFTVNGTRYHHILDPETLYPGTYWRSVTVVCADSGLADALSTALFVMPLAEGMELAKRCGVEVMWVDADAARFYTDGFAALLRT